MKKIFTLLLAAVACSMSVSAAQYELSHDGQVLADGAKYQVGYTVETQDLGGLTMYIVKQDAGLSLKADPSVELMVTVISSNPNLQFCGFDGLCQSGPLMTKSGHTKTDSPESLEIDLITKGMGSMPTAIPTVNIQVIVYAKNAPSDITTVNIEMLDKSAEEVGSVSSITYDGPQGAAVYYNILGQRVEHPTKGVYIKRQGNKTTKVIIK